jgi:fructose-1,6-bisphosphatase II
MKNLHLDLIKVTEAGAVAAAEWIGRGDKESADKVAVNAMRERLNQMEFSAEIAIGEGIKDNSYGLYEGEIVGAFRKTNPNLYYSIAVDPIEGTTPTSKGGYEAISVIALGDKNALYKSKYFYMNKLAAGPKVNKRTKLSILDPISVTVTKTAKALGKSPQHTKVCVIDRDRSNGLVKELRKIGCSIKFIQDCDVTACMATCDEDSGVDLYCSVGGCAEGVLTAAAMKCMGGFFEAQEVTDNYNNPKPINDKVLTIDDLAKGDVMFAATGITNGSLLRGVRYKSRGAITHSIGMRSESQTIRWMTTEHGN